MTKFVKFVETNDHEGEEWTFWLQIKGNVTELHRLHDIITQFEADTEREPEYRLYPKVVLDEHDVDVLVAHGGRGYMNNHTKVRGTLTMPNDLVKRDEYGLTLDDLYKGRIMNLFVLEDPAVTEVFDALAKPWEYQESDRQAKGS
jgi:hypothetical protein